MEGRKPKCVEKTLDREFEKMPHIQTDQDKNWHSSNCNSDSNGDSKGSSNGESKSDRRLAGSADMPAFRPGTTVSR